MINWMQKHKKYLIVTIWISTIAFISAGMVGWGSYSFSSASGSVAKVGKIAISNDDFNREYQTIYNHYNQQYNSMGKQLDNEEAKKIGLDNIAIQRLINKALLENFAHDIGIRVSKEEIAKEIQDVEDFKTNNVFDNNLYKQILKQNHLKPSVFEDNIKKDLFIQKILAIFPQILTPFEKEVMSLAINLKDKLAIQIINLNQIKINITDKELQEFYEKNKDSYKSPKEFEVEIIETKLSDIKVNEEDLQVFYNDNISDYTINGIIQDFDKIQEKLINDFKQKKAQKIALKAYIDFRDKKINGNKTTFSQYKISDEILDSLNLSKEGDFIKPILNNDTFITMKIIKKIPQTIKSFNEAKDEITKDYRPIALKKGLEKEVKAKVNLFNGLDIGYYSIWDIKPIPALQDFEKQQLLANIFSNNKKNGYLILSDKAILYKILDQKILKNISNETEIDIFNNLKSNILEQTIVNFLTKKYKIVNNFKKDS